MAGDLGGDLLVVFCANTHKPTVGAAGGEAIEAVTVDERGGLDDTTLVLTGPGQRRHAPTAGESDNSDAVASIYLRQDRLRLRGIGARPPTALTVAYIKEHKESRVEPWGQLTLAGDREQLEIAPSIYYAHRARPPSARSVTDAGTTTLI